MYDHIRGRLIELAPTRAVIEAGGVGYELTIPLSTYRRLKERGDLESVQLFTHLYVREDVLRLFGFGDPQERGCFEMILRVSGIGPTTAVSLLSSLSVEEIRKAIQQGSARTLQRIKGVGRKTAERLILELGGRLPEVDTAAADPVPTEEFELALISLGFSPSQIDSAARLVRKEATPGASLEDLIKLALRTPEARS